VRACPGGTGAIKCGGLFLTHTIFLKWETRYTGNYAASLLASEIAHTKGCSQVLWLDGVQRKYVEEVGSMNIMFVINGTIVTPPLHGTILPGVTRDTILTIAHDLGYQTEERLVSIVCEP